MDLLTIQRRIRIESISDNFKGNFIGINYDSRKVMPGDIFFAIRGEVVDGHAFIDEARKRGAVCVCLEDPEGCRLPYIQVEDTRTALASLSALFYGDPSKSIKVIGVVGTKGKTSVAWMLGHILRTSGKKTAVMGTLGLRKEGGEYIDFGLTTPPSLEIQRELKNLVDKKYDSIVMEVTAHAIHLKRIVDVHFDRGIFTNIGQDHLDFFGWDDYVSTKKRFFEEMTLSRVKEGLALLNADDEYFGSFVVASHDKYLSYAIDSDADVRLLSQDRSGVCMVKTPEGNFKFKPRIPGRFNLINNLAAISTALTLGVSLNDMAKALESFPGVPGRYQKVPSKAPFSVFVDYAHNPSSVEAILKDAKEGGYSKVIALIGCGGDRDRDKRPKMGRIARELADEIIITSDNPRTEDPNRIIQDIVVGVREAESESPYHIEPDREKAIALGISLLREGDALFILGKGHENYQILATEKIHFDDVEIAGKYLKRRLADEGHG